MALISRFSRLFRADLNAVLDKIEEPVVLLKQAVREMEEEVAADERNFKILQHELTQIPHLEQEVEASLKSLQDEIQLCLNDDNESLARSVIKRKLENQLRLKRLQQKTKDIKREVAVIDERVSSNKTRLAGMQQKLEILEEESSNELAGQRSYDIDVPISNDDIEVALLKEKQARSTS